jgi:predicted nucleotidyltransferase
MRVQTAELLREARRRARLTQTELARRAGTSQPNVNRTERGVSEPALSTLRRLVRVCGFDLQLRLVRKRETPLSQLLEERREEILERLAARGATNIRVFGSVARGEETEDSDLDLLVELAPGRDVVDLAALREDLENVLGVRVDLSTPALLRPEARRRALAEGLPL